MFNLWLGVAVLSLLAALFVVYPVWKQSRNRIDQVVTSDPQRDNIAIFKDRLSELEQERSSGSLSEPDFEALKIELEKTLLIDTDTQTVQLSSKAISPKQFVGSMIIALLIIVSSVMLYSKVGSAPALEVALNMSEVPAEGSEPSLDEAIAQLRAELALQPENPEGWYVLASTLMGQSDYQGALDAYRNSLSYLTSEDIQYATVMGQLSQAMFFVSGGMTPEVKAQVDATLEAEPFEITALGILGIDAFERQSYREAIAHWSKALINADASSAPSLQNGVERARNELIALGEDVSDIDLPASASIALNISIDASRSQGLPSDTPVFVVARPNEGGMPLAGLRLTVGDLPAELVLTDANAMTPQAKLSDLSQVTVSARVSLSGNVVPQPGDMVVEVANVPTKGLEQPLEMVVLEVVE